MRRLVGGVVSGVLLALAALPAHAAAAPLQGVWYEPHYQEREQAHIGFIVREGGQTLYNLAADFVPAQPDPPRRCGKVFRYEGGDVPIAPDGTFAVDEHGSRIEGRFTSETTAEGTWTYIDGCGPRVPETHAWVAAWEGGKPPPASGSPGSGGPPENEPPPAPSDRPGCRAQLELGAVTVVAECLREDHGTWVAEGRARVNGIDVTPGAGARLVLDPGRLRITASGEVTVAVGGIVLFRGPFAWSADGAFDFSAGGDAKIRGLPVSGRIEGRWTPAASQLTVHVGLGPDFGNITGDATLSATNEHGLALDRLSVSLADSDLRLLRSLALHAASLSYVRSTDTWTGAIELGLPAGREIAGSLSIKDGRFASASAAADNLNMPLGQVLFLQRIGVGVAVNPLTLHGDAAFTGGPRLNVLGHDLSALEGDVGVTWRSGRAYDTWTLNGSVKLASFRVGDASVVFRPGLDVTFHGGLEFSLLRVGFEGAVDGWIAGLSSFQARAAGHIRLPIVGDADAEALVSSRGMGACGSKRILFGTVSGGVTYRWGRSPRVFEGGCDFGEVEVQRRARAAQAAPGITLAGERRAALLAIRGAGGAPRVTVTGPRGLSIARGDEGAALTDRAYLLEVPEQATTYVVLARPAAGRYSVAPAPGGPPVTAVGSADVLPQPRVTAHVRGRGARRVLSWSVRPIPGQRVAFVERGGGVARTIVTTSRRRGSVRFRPGRGLGGRRHIIALVLQRGLPRRQLTVAGFGAAAARVRAPRRVRARSGRRGLTISWRRSAGATGYDVRLTLRDGRRLLRIVGPRSRSVRFGGVARRARGRVAVVARGIANDEAPAARATLRPRRR